MNKARRTKQYGLTPEQWDQMVKEQDGRCAIPSCRRLPQPEKTLHIDHSHKTGAVRRLLCHRCNTAIGLLSDDPAILRDLADYLEEFQ